MRRASFLIVALAACGPKSAPPTSGGAENVGVDPPPAAPVGALPVDFAVFDTTSVVIFRADATGLTELHAIELPDVVSGGTWRNADELFLTTGDGKLFVIAGGQAKEIVLPPPEAWAQPNPQPGGDLEPVGMEELKTDADGNVWLSRCQWGQIYDGGYCEVWSHARVAPGAVTMGEAPGKWLLHVAWIKPAPAGFGITSDTFTPPRDPEDGDAPSEPLERVRCEGPRGVTMMPDDEGADGGDFYGVMVGPWVSHDPPQFLVGYLQPGMYEYVPTWRLHRACEPEPVAELTAHELGPAGVWAYAIEEGGWRVMLDGQELGKVPDNLYGLSFAPPRP